MNRPTHHITRSRLQLEVSARQMLRNALSQPNVTDDEAIAYATASMGAEHAALVVRVFARDFKATQPI